MALQRFFIKGKTLDVYDPSLQEALDRIYETPERPCCMCVQGGVEMYVAKHLQYVAKRMPGPGTCTIRHVLSMSRNMGSPG